VASQLDLRKVAEPLLRSLAEKARETVHMVIMDKDEAFGAMLRGTGLGFPIGLISGPAPVLATYASYMVPFAPPMVPLSGRCLGRNNPRDRRCRPICGERDGIPTAGRIEGIRKALRDVQEALRAVVPFLR